MAKPMSFQPASTIRRTNGLAVASLVLGILGITGPAFIIGPVLALVFGYRGRDQIDRSGGLEEGRGLAVAGIVLGWVGVGFALFFLLFFVVAVAAVTVHTSHSTVIEHTIRVGRSVILRP